MALGVMRALYKHGMKVPDDVSVVGYDDMPEAAYFNPSLTSVTHDFETAGRICLEFLLRLIRDPDAPAERFILKPDLIPRESTGKREKRPRRNCKGRSKHAEQ